MTSGTRFALLTTLLPALAGCSIRRAADDFFAQDGGESTTTDSSGAPDESSSSSSGSSEGDAEASSEDTRGTDTSTSTTAATTSSGDSESMTSEPDPTTAGPPAVCGDGVVAGDEECDDANANDVDDACTSTCARPRLAFLTSALYNGGDIHGLEGADNRCRKAALDANLPEPVNFKALLSDSITSAADRLHHSRGPYRLVNGLQVARDWEALMHESLEHPLDTTELGTKGVPAVWTGTGPGGVAVVDTNHCEDWNSMSFNDYGSWGDPTYVDSGWWLDEPNPVVNPTDCATQQALYCLEQE